MTRKIPSVSEIEAFLLTQPGKRGIDIPIEQFDKIQPVAHGMSMQTWGRAIEPQQLQDLFDGGHHQPEQVKTAMGSLPHPHAPSVSVNDYTQYAAAKTMFDHHQGSPSGSKNAH